MYINVWESLGAIIPLTSMFLFPCENSVILLDSKSTCAFIVHENMHSFYFSSSQSSPCSQAFPFPVRFVFGWRLAASFFFFLIFLLPHQYDQSLSKGLLFSTVCPVWLMDVKIQLIPRAGLHTLTFSAFCFNVIDCSDSTVSRICAVKSGSQPGTWVCQVMVTDITSVCLHLSMYHLH